MKNFWQFLSQKLKIFFKILTAVYARFHSHQGFLISNGLTIKTIFALIPGLLFIIGILKIMLPFTDYMENFYELLKTYVVPGSFDVVVTWINRILEKTNTISFFSALIFIYLSVNLLITIDNQVERIWSVKVKRPKIQKILRYWALFSGTPFALGGYFYYSGLIRSFIAYSPLSQITYLNEFFLASIAFLISCTFIFLVNYIIPNTKIHLIKAIIIAIATSFCWVVLRFTLTLFIPILIGRWSLIYGYFAMIILFVVWTSSNWTVLLFGVEFLCVWQNQLYKKNVIFKELFLFDVGFQVLIIQDFYLDFNKKGKGIGINKLAEKYKCSYQDIKEIITLLEEEDIIIGDNTIPQKFHLKKDISVIDLSVIETIVWKRLTSINYETMPGLKKICQRIGKLYYNRRDQNELSLDKILR